MDEGLWDNYKEGGEYELYDRGSITSELELNDSEFREIEDELDFSVDEVFDIYIEGEESDLVGGTTQAAAGSC